MARIVVLTFNADTRQRLLDAVRRVRPVFCGSERGLVQALGTDGCDAVIVGLRGKNGASEAELIQSVRAWYPLMWIVGCLEGGHDRTHEVRLVAAASRAGANEIVVDGVDSYESLYERLAMSAAEWVVSQRVLQTTKARVPDVVQQFIVHGVLQARHSVSVASVAKVIGVSRHTLARQCRNAGLPAPERFLTWSRLLLAGAVLDQPGMTADRVGYRMFGSPSAFRKMLQTYVGVSPRVLRERGGFEMILTEFGKILDRRSAL